jgi:hypothetical protein
MIYVWDGSSIFIEIELQLWVFNVTFNNISIMSSWVVLLVEETRVSDFKKNTDLPQITDKIYHIKRYKVQLKLKESSSQILINLTK